MFGQIIRGRRWRSACGMRDWSQPAFAVLILPILLLAAACGAPAGGSTPTPTPPTSLNDALEVWLEAPDLSEPGESVAFTLRVRNTTGAPLRLWGGVNHFDIVVAAEDGAEVWSFWHGKAVPAVLINVTFEPGEVKDYLVQCDQVDNDGDAIPSGLYAARGAFIASLTDDAELERLDTEPRWLAVQAVHQP